MKQCKERRNSETVKHNMKQCKERRNSETVKHNMKQCKERHRPHGTDKVYFQFQRFARRRVMLLGCKMAARKQGGTDEEEDDDNWTNENGEDGMMKA